MLNYCEHGAFLPQGRRSGPGRPKPPDQGQNKPALRRMAPKGGYIRSYRYRGIFLPSAGRLQTEVFFQPLVFSQYKQGHAPVQHGFRRDIYLGFTVSLHAEDIDAVFPADI